MDNRLETAVLNAISMLNTVAECSSHECIDCREFCALKRDELRNAYYKWHASRDAKGPGQEN